MRHQKPLSRTQSLPLPVMRPEAAASILLPQQQALLEHQELVKQHQDQLNKQHQKKMVLGVSDLCVTLSCGSGMLLVVC